MNMSTGKFYKKKSDFMSRYIGDESASGIGQDDSSGSEDNNPLGNVELSDDDDLTFEPPPSKSQRKVGNKLSRSTGRKTKAKTAPKKPINRKSAEGSEASATPVPSPPETSKSAFDEGQDVYNEDEDAADLANSNKKKKKPLTASQLLKKVREQKRHQLCELVQSHEFLYRKGHPDHSNRDKLNNVWVQITHQIGETNGKWH